MLLKTLSGALCKFSSIFRVEHSFIGMNTRGLLNFVCGFSCGNCFQMKPASAAEYKLLAAGKAAKLNASQDTMRIILVCDGVNQGAGQYLKTWCKNSTPPLIDSSLDAPQTPISKNSLGCISDQ